MLRDRVVGRQLARGEYVRRERVAGRGPEVLVLELRVDRPRRRLELGRRAQAKAPQQRRAAGAQLVM